MVVIQWTEKEGDRLCTPLSWWEDYVISHRPSRFIVSYRPTGKHIHVGEYTTIEAAKEAAETHQEARKLVWNTKQKPSFPDWMEQQLGRNWVVASRTKRIIEKYGPDVTAITARKLKRMREQWLNI